MGSAASLGKRENHSKKLQLEANQVQNYATLSADDLSMKSQNAESQPTQKHTDHMRALNMIQRQQDELAELRQQLQQRDLELRLIRDLRTREEPATTDEGIKMRDLRIRKLDEESERAKTELAKQKGRYKRKIRDLLTQLADVKQSSAIRIMELRQEVHQLNMENRQLKERLGLSETVLVAPTSSSSSAAAAVAASVASPRAGSGTDPSKSLIVELSTQLSNQADQILRLQRRLAKREARLAELESSSSSAAAAASARPVVPSLSHQLDSSVPAAAPAGEEEDEEEEEDNDELGTDRSNRYYAGDADSVYSDDTLLFVEMQQEVGSRLYRQQHLKVDRQDSDASSTFSGAATADTAAATGPGGGHRDHSTSIIIDSYKQRTIDKLLQD